MKLAIICLTKDFNRPGNSGSYRDYLYIKKELESIADVVTINAENVISEMEKDFDGIIMLNASVNFFGGVLNETLVNKWQFITSQSCPVIYWFTDFLLPLVKVDELINKRFNRSLIPLSSKRLSVISYAQEVEMTREWWNKNPKNIPVTHIVYYPISESCYKHLPHLEPKEAVNDNIVYIGNFRNGHRLKQIEKLSNEREISIYGNWPDKFVPFGANYHGKISEDKVDSCLNSYYAQYITYDYEYIKFKPDIFRHIITINSGCLPLVDPALDYIIPLLASNYPTDLKGHERIQAIQLLQVALKSQFPNRFSNLIQTICSSF